MSRTLKDRRWKEDRCFHKGGKYHDTYARQRKYVQSLGNIWAMENFEATKPYFA